MINLSYFLEKCPNFPKISVEERRLIQVELRLEFRKLEGLKRIPERYHRPEDKLALLNYDFIKAFIGLDGDLTIDLFFDKELAKNTDTMHLLWLDAIKHFFSTTSAKKTSVYYLILFRNLFSEPTSFAALIIYLLQNEITAHQIIFSRILHDFFDYKIVEIDEIHKTYAFIQNHSALPAVEELLALARQTHCGLSSFPDTNLLGENHCSSLHTIPDTGIEIEIAAQESDEFMQIFKNLHHIFGYYFIFDALTLKNYDQEEQLSTMITEWINHISVEKLEKFFDDIKKQYHQSQQYTLFKNLCPSLTPSQARYLFNKAELFWIILSTSPALFLTYTKESLRTLSLEKPIVLKDIDYIHALCHHKKFTKQQEYFYKKIFDLHLEHSELPHESSLCDELFHCPKRSQWVITASATLSKRLIREILNNIQSFDTDAFINIRDFYYGQRFQVDFLCAQGGTLDNYPMDFYSFTTLILNLIFQKKAIINLDEVLTAMVPHQATDGDSKQQMMARIALESFKKTKNQRQILSILITFKNYFSYTIEKIFELSESQNINLLELALTNKENLEFTLKLLPEHIWLRFFNHRAPPRFENGLSTILQSSSMLCTLIEESSSEWLMSFLEQIYRKKNFFWLSLGLNSSVYQAIFRKMTIDQKIQILGLSSSHNENILHFTIAKREILEILFQNAPYVLRYFLIQQKNDELESPLFLALQYPDSFAFILENTTSELHENILLEHQKDGKNTYQLAMKNIELLLIIHTHLDTSNLLKLLHLHFSEIIHLYANRADVLTLLFENMPSSELNELLLENDHYGLNQTLVYPDSFVSILRLLNPHERLKLLNMPCERLPSHSVFYYFLSLKPNRIESILELLDPKQILTLMQQDDIFEYVLENTESLSSIFKSLPRAYQYRLSLFQNSKQESWQDLISLNQATSLNLFLPLLPNPLVLFHNTILYRAINHPLSLSTLFNLIPIEERLSLIQSHDPSLFFQLKEAKSILAILKLLPEEEHLIFLQEKHRTGSNLLGFILSQHHELYTMLNYLQPYNLYLMIRKIINHHLPAQAFLANEQSLIMIIQSLPSTTTIQFLKELCEQQEDRLVSSANRLILLKYFLNQGKLINPYFCSLSPAEKKHPLYSISLYREYLPHLTTLEKHLSELPPSPRTRKFV